MSLVKDRWRWFRWVLFHLPGPSIFHKRPPLVLNVFLGVWWFLQRNPHRQQRGVDGYRIYHIPSLLAINSRVRKKTTEGDRRWHHIASLFIADAISPSLSISFPHPSHQLLADISVRGHGRRFPRPGGTLRQMFGGASPFHTFRSDTHIVFFNLHLKS